VNKEKAALNSFQQRALANGGSVPGVPPGAMSRTRDVIYWYLDYREFSDVVKYRIAMMRKGIDEKMKSEVGKRGYLCPLCHKVYDPLDLAHLFDSRASAFLCEVDSTELIEDDPAMHGDESAGQDRMQRFNVATAPIRDALKSIEGARNIPTLNIVAWIAQNVKTEAAPAEAEGAEVRRVDVVFGVDGAPKEEDKKAHEALPVWYTQSTITGEMTAEGNKEAVAQAKAAAAASAAAGPSDDGPKIDDLSAYYDQMEEEEAALDDTIDTTESTPAPDTSAVATPSGAADVVVMVAGKPMKIADVTEADEELMTPDEYEAYFEATAAQV
jgi:transcription initiation factor TFIIE subunit alpha